MSTPPPQRGQGVPQPRANGGGKDGEEKKVIASAGAGVPPQQFMFGTMNMAKSPSRQPSMPGMPPGGRPMPGAPMMGMMPPGGKPGMPGMGMPGMPQQMQPGMEQMQPGMGMPPPGGVPSLGGLDPMAMAGMAMPPLGGLQGGAPGMGFSGAAGGFPGAAGDAPGEYRSQ